MGHHNVRSPRSWASFTKTNTTDDTSAIAIQRELSAYPATIGACLCRMLATTKPSGTVRSVRMASELHKRPDGLKR